MLNIVSFILGLLSLVIVIPSTIPLLGWGNWFALPLIVAGIVVGQLSSKRSGRNFCLIVLLIAAVRLTQQVGVDNVIKVARDLGVTAPLTEDLSLALGTSEIPLIELAEAYAAVAAGAYPVVAHGLPPEDQGKFVGFIMQAAMSCNMES